jgi:hypothetical protein
MALAAKNEISTIGQNNPAPAIRIMTDYGSQQHSPRLFGSLALMIEAQRGRLDR